MELTSSVKTISAEAGVSIEGKGFAAANFSMKEFLNENDVTVDIGIIAADVPMEDITVKIITHMGEAVPVKKKASTENEVLLRR